MEGEGMNQNSLGVMYYLPKTITQYRPRSQITCKPTRAKDQQLISWESVNLKTRFQGKGKDDVFPYSKFET